MSGTFFKDVNGNVSSKRIAGYALMVIALVAGFWGALKDNQMVVDYCKWILTTGGAAVIAGVAERRS